MHQYATEKLVHILARISDAKESAVHHRERNYHWPENERQKTQKSLGEALPWLEDLGLGNTKHFWEKFIQEIPHLDIRAIEMQANDVREILKVELSQRTFFVLNQDNVKFYNNPLSASDRVRGKWGYANQELIEAGNCLALARHKACVFHCCIAYEIGLTTLARRLKVKKQDNWGNYLRAIRAELSKRFQRRANRHRKFYAECAERFDAIRIGRRNPTSHFELDSYYTEEEARDIFGACCAFLKHLSMKMDESS